jgi:hypothetical protein
MTSRKAEVCCCAPQTNQADELTQQRLTELRLPFLALNPERYQDLMRDVIPGLDLQHADALPRADPSKQRIKGDVVVRCAIHRVRAAQPPTTKLPRLIDLLL